MKRLLKQLLQVSGYEIRKIPQSLGWQGLVEQDSYRRLGALIRYYGINHVLDVGAFKGQFGTLLIRRLGYQGRITSFEPVVDYFRSLQQASSSFRDRWSARNIALGDSCGDGIIKIAGNAYSSSLLPMLPTHEALAPDSAYVGQQPITIATLDSVFEACCSPRESLYLKIDVQGFERQVLAGAQQSLQAINTVQLELSLVPLYKDETLLAEMIEHMKGMGFELVLLIPGFANEETGELLQVDAVFRRHS